MKKIVSYEKAYQELETILEDLVADEVSVDALSKKIKRAKELVNYCKTKLRDVEHDVQSVVEDDEE
jgi:exodeoxyribonuclease VII small subunit